MNNFREWLSDNLRYILLILAILAVVAISVAGIVIYKKLADPAPQTEPSQNQSVQVETEPATKKETETTKETEETEPGTQKETKTSEPETESVSEIESESQAVNGETNSTEKNSETEDGTSAVGETEKNPEYLRMTVTTNFRTGPGEEYDVMNSYGTDRVAKFLGKEGDWYKVLIGGREGYMSAQYLEEVAYEPGMEEEVQTEPATEPPTEPQPVYKTLKGACYLRAETSKESQILGTYSAGTTIEFLEDVGGWYHVQVDGMTGYMGAQFF